jgi:hypothetical protein
MKEETPPRRREGGKKVGFSFEFVTTSVTLTREEKMQVIVKLKKYFKMLSHCQSDDH